MPTWVCKKWFMQHFRKVFNTRKGYNSIIYPPYNNRSQICCEWTEIFKIANKVGKNLVKDIKAQGINILVASGYAAGQKADHIVVHIIPRFQDDKINFDWTPKEINEEDLDRIKGLIKFEKEKPISYRRYRIVTCPVCGGSYRLIDHDVCPNCRVEDNWRIFNG